jgi:hypothetical protein
MVELRIELGSDLSQVLERVVEKVDSGLNGVRALLLTHRRVEQPVGVAGVSSTDMYNNDVGKESAQKFMKQTGDLKAATLYFAS